MILTYSIGKIKMDPWYFSSVARLLEDVLTNFLLDISTQLEYHITVNN